ncbi:DUF6343 family protein [Streptomyces viridosporus]|uniref:DUF6343 family protein n=1 Tax=Streptomyces viridosporus TaxID=67581 RepID=UPI0009BCDAF6|nr:DUF6343 family protein [Streptomyces viridosporus]
MSDERSGRRTEPVPRSRSGALGSRSPRSGTEPRNAQSPLGLRLLLSGVFLPVFCVAAVLFGLWAANSGPGDSPGRDVLTGLAVGCGVLALIAAVDLLVVVRRRRRERGIRG